MFICTACHSDNYTLCTCSYGLHSQGRCDACHNMGDGTDCISPEPTKTRPSVPQTVSQEATTSLSVFAKPESSPEPKLDLASMEAQYNNLKELAKEASREVDAARANLGTAEETLNVAIRDLGVRYQLACKLTKDAVKLGQEVLKLKLQS